MSKLPVLSGDETVVAFCKAGFRKSRQRGSHMYLVKDGYPKALSVPLHRELAPGTLRALIRNSGLSVEEFTALI